MRLAAKMEDRVRELGARAQIQAALMRNARGIDRLDRELILSSYHPDGLDNHGAFNGPADGFADWVIGRHAGKIAVCTHLIGNILLRIDGATARCETYNSVFYRTPNAHGGFTDMAAFGRYVDRFELRGGLWRIASRLVVFEKDRLDPVILQQGDGMTENIVRGRRDRQDASYDLLPTIEQSAGASLEDLAARQEIHDVLMRLCRGVDRLDVALIDTAFHPEARIVDGELSGSPKEFAVRLREAEANTVKSSVQMVGNVLIQVNGDLASCESYCLRTRRFTVADQLMDHTTFCRYLDQLEKREGVWKIVARTVVVDKERTDPVTAQWEGPLTQATLKGVRSADDASYQAFE